MFNINGWELVIIAAIALIVFGPERLPELAFRLGRLLHQVRAMTDEATAEMTREFQAATKLAENRIDPGRAPGAPAAVMPPADSPDRAGPGPDAAAAGAPPGVALPGTAVVVDDPVPPAAAPPPPPDTADAT